MILPDVNVLVYAHREDAPAHILYRNWLESVIMRIVTHPRIFNPPSPLEQAFMFVGNVRNQPNCVLIQPGPRHWRIFEQLCRESYVKGNLIPDAYLAAMAIESGSEWITTDRDYSRFENLKWRHPLDG